VHAIYLSSLEDRLRRNERVDQLVSVASLFLSRIDTLLDPRLEKIIEQGGERAAQARELLGTIAIANAKVAYQKFREVQAGARWDELRRHGARTQRLLWASTSPKNPTYDELHYVEPLVAPETVATLTEKTIAALRQHGKPEIRVGDQLDRNVRRLQTAEALGLSLGDAFRELQEEGLRKFVEPFDKVLGTLRRKVAATSAA